MSNPLLSVLIDTYNHEKYIEQCVLSAIEQDFPASDYEIVVVDDGSTDRTQEIVAKFAPRVRLLRKKNGGQASAFNAALPELRGDIVAFLDGDDWFAPGKLTAVMNALEQHPEAAAVGHGHYEFDEETGQATAWVPEREKVLHLATREAAREASSGWPFLLMGAFTARRKVVERVLPLPERLAFCADAPITWSALAIGVFVLEQPLFYYRHHAENLFALGQDGTARARRRYEMLEAGHECMEPLLLRLGVRRDCVRALLYPHWVETSRSSLRAFGGSRVKTFRTEMRDFQAEHPHPNMSYRLFKYVCVGGATLLLPPRAFYRVRDWYGRRNLGGVREQLLRAR